MPFQPGQSGNPGGKNKAKPFREALMMEMLAAERGDPCEAQSGSLRWNARKLLEKGDVATIKELADRLDGKVPQGVIGGDDDDPPIAFAGTVTLSATGALIAEIAGSRAGSAPSKSGAD